MAAVRSACEWSTGTPCVRRRSTSAPRPEPATSRPGSGLLCGARRCRSMGSRRRSTPETTASRDRCATTRSGFARRSPGRRRRARRAATPASDRCRDARSPASDIAERAAGLGCERGVVVDAPHGCFRPHARLPVGRPPAGGDGGRAAERCRPRHARRRRLLPPNRGRRDRALRPECRILDCAHSGLAWRHASRGRRIRDLRGVRPADRTARVHRRTRAASAEHHQ